jgi:hypothetical protein
MPADSDYSEILERLADGHQERLSNALKTLENNVASIMDNAPIKDGKLFDLEWAVNARPELRSALEADYLSEVDSIVRDYAGVSADASKMLSTYGDFTKLDSAVISQLQGLSFQGFQAVANEYLDVLANEVYQSTLTGRAFNDTVKNLRQTINGVYIQSDSVEANRLVDIAANGTKAQQADAVRQLQTIYARDRVGNNLRRYATQMAQDSLMQFDASINTAIGKQSGATKWKYYGTTVRDTRPFCREHVNQVFTTEEIEKTWAGSWKGKAAGDPYIVRGGYNCRHHWRPVFDEEPDTQKTQSDQEKSILFGEDIEFRSGNLSAEETRSQYNVALSALSAKQIAVANKLPKPTILFANEEGSYTAKSKTLSSDPLERGGSVARHEYGHHVDYELQRLKVDYSFPVAISTTDKEFAKAFNSDKRKLGVVNKDRRKKASAEIIDDLYDVKLKSIGGRMTAKLTIKNEELGNFADIVDAMTVGKFQETYGGFGHGVKYYKGNKDAQLKEAFANLFALRNTDEWPRVEKYFPKMAKRFDELLEEAL